MPAASSRASRILGDCAGSGVRLLASRRLSRLNATLAILGVLALLSHACRRVVDPTAQSEHATWTELGVDASHDVASSARSPAPLVPNADPLQVQPSKPRLDSETSKEADPRGAPNGPLSLHFGQRRPAVYYTPNTRSHAQAVVVVLHGMCALPEYECPVFRRGATSGNWLLCPPGPTPCQGGGAMWTGSAEQLTATVTESLQALKREHSMVDIERKVLVGYSLGAAAALRIASASNGEWTGLMLLNAGLEPNPVALAAAGIRQVALVAGERDGSRAKLRRAANRLVHAGLDARFFSLASTGHFFDGTSEARLVEPLEWLCEAALQ